MKLLLENWREYRRKTLIEQVSSSNCEGEGEFFHSLPSSLIKAVLKGGLRINPSDSKSKFGLGEYSSRKIFVSMGHGNAVRWQIQVEEVTGEPAGIIRLDLPDNLINALESDTQAVEDGDPCAFFLEEGIPPKYLTLADYGPSDYFESGK